MYRRDYHYMPEAAPRRNWAISCFGTGIGPQRAWRILREDDEAVMVQAYDNKRVHTHPMVVVGDELWTDYTVTVQFAPETDRAQSGLVFRYRNDRCYYFLASLAQKRSSRWCVMPRHSTSHTSKYSPRTTMPDRWESISKPQILPTVLTCGSDRRNPHSIV